MAQLQHSAANTVTWTGSIDNAWSNPGNWDGDVVPTLGSNVFIAGATVVLSASISINQLSLTSPTTLILANATIDVADTLAIEATSGDDVTLSGIHANVRAPNVLVALGPQVLHSIELVSPNLVLSGYAVCDRTVQITHHIHVLIAAVCCSCCCECAASVW